MSPKRHRRAALGHHWAGFSGGRADTDLGLVHMNGRIYDPLLGRFLSADIVVQNPTSLQSYNRYSYVLNNPLTNTDPTGFYSILGLEFTDGGGVLGFMKDAQGYMNAATSGAAEGAVAYGKGLVQGAVATLEGTASAIAHPIDTVQATADGLGTLAGRAIYDTGGLVSDIKNVTVETLSDPNKIGQVVGSVVADTALGVGMAKVADKAMDAGKALAKLDDAAPAPKLASAVPEQAPTTQMGCFVAGTLVLTADGFERIEDVQVGELVLSFNENTGEFELKPVLVTSERDYSGDFVIVGVDGVSIEATGNHPFLVLAGQDLDQRPEVTEIKLAQTAGKYGRWVEARHLHIGDTVLLGAGETAVVGSLNRYVGRAPVYNFLIADNHTYLVSEAGVVVHNNPCAQPAGGTGAGIDYKLKQPEGVSSAEWKGKMDALNEQAAAGEAKIVHEPDRPPEALQAQRQARSSGMIQEGHHADHALDLQFGGKPGIENIRSTPARINTSVGAQGKARLSYPDGTKIRRFVDE